MRLYCLTGMLSLTLVLGPWLSLRTKFQSLVLALALNLQSLVLALNFKSLVQSFCHNRLVVQWYGPWFMLLGNTDSSLLPTTAFCSISFHAGYAATYQLSNFQPTRLATTDALPEVRQHPATSELRSVFAGYVCTCGTCVLSEWTVHASKSSTHVQLSVENFGLP